MKSAEADRERGPSARAEARIGPRDEDEERGLHEAADQVVGGRCSRLRLEEVVVDDVERCDAECNPRETRLRTKGCRDPRRGSLSGFGSRVD